MSNGFNKKIYELWHSLSPDSGAWYECFACGQNHTDCLHHNFGRGGGRGERGQAFNSFLNSVPLNNGLCHLPRHGANKRNSDWLTRTHGYFEQLIRYHGYKVTRKDKEFSKIHEEIYKKLNLTLFV